MGDQHRAHGDIRSGGNGMAQRDEHQQIDPEGRNRIAQQLKAEKRDGRRRQKNRDAPPRGDQRFPLRFLQAEQRDDACRRGVLQPQRKGQSNGGAGPGRRLYRLDSRGFEQSLQAHPPPYAGGGLPCSVPRSQSLTLLYWVLHTISTPGSSNRKFPAYDRQNTAENRTSMG